MALSWNEIKTRAAAFINEWKDLAPTAREEADAQTFQTDFLNIFGVKRSQVAIFEQKVPLPGEARGYIDLFWKGHIMIEMKSPGKDMQKAFEQAKQYANGLKPTEIPKAILICDFVHFHYYNLEENAKLTEFVLGDLGQYVELFSDLAGYKDVEYKKQEEVNIDAAERMGKLHDQLKKIGYEGHQLEVYLVRLLFCLFAEDTGIFEKDLFSTYIQQRTQEDGSDLALHIQTIFEVLNKPEDHRLKNIDEQLNKFPYVNGSLFEEHLETAAFDSKMREALLYCSALDWSKISPAIFGAMFQSVMNPEERRNLGAHYTSEENILKLIHPLFLDDLWDEFEKYRKLKSDVRVARLNQFHEKLEKLKFLDPACGCGNFLIITYREIRLLELAVLKELSQNQALALDINEFLKVNVDQFYGIEIEEFPSRIAQVAMWLMDHQMNMIARDMFGHYFIRIPLKETASIICGNSLDIPWGDIIPKADLSYILGNPPFIGARWMSSNQKKDLLNLFQGVKNCGNLDYVTCWYKKAAIFIQGTNIRCAFVSTNSICQGGQVDILWRDLFDTHKIVINYAHQTFKWSNEAKGNAAVFCIIVGFALTDSNTKKIFIYPSVSGNPLKTVVKQINGYLVDAPQVFVTSRKSPLCNVPSMGMGNQPIDNGNYLFSSSEKEEFLNKEPGAKKFFYKWIGGDEFINGWFRWCLYLGKSSPDELKKMPLCIERVNAVREYREQSTRLSTKKLSKTPTRFQTENIPHGSYLVIPEVSSENRVIIPMGFISADTLCSNKLRLMPNATLYHFGILTSSMHMAWVRYVCGRLEMRYSYSIDIVYNNFPWPAPNDKQQTDIEQAAQVILDTRLMFPTSNLADLYGPNTMPPELSKAHDKLDKLVEKAYGKKFDNDADRVAFLFERYQELTADFLSEPVKKQKAKKA